MSQGGPVSAPAPATEPSPVAVEPVDDLHAIAYEVAIATPQAPLYRRADTTLRILAAGIDVLAFGFAFMVLGILVQVTWIHRLFWWIDHADAIISLGAIHLWLLLTLTEVFGVATPGKRLVDIRIASVDFTPASTRQRVSRWALRRMPDLALLALVWAFVIDHYTTIPVTHETYGLLIQTMMALQGLVFVAMLFSGGRQRLALYDRMLGTSVIEANAGKRGGVGRAFGVISRGASG